MATELENLIPEADVEVEGMRGPKGDKGDSYVLTEADKEEIAQKVDKIIDAETDKTLTLSGKPADAKAAGDEINDLKADLSKMQTATAENIGKALKAKAVTDGKVTEWEFGEAGGDAEEITKKLELKNDGNNACNPDKMLVGYVPQKTGVPNPSLAQYRYTEMIPVQEGQIVRFYSIIDSTFAARMCVVAAYDSDKNPLTSSGAVNVFTYTVKPSVEYIIVTFPVASAYMVTIDYIASAYEEYQKPYYIATDEFIDKAVAEKLDVSLKTYGEIADAGATGKAIREVKDIASAGNVVKYGNFETVTRSEMESIVPIDNSNLDAPIANAVKAKFLMFEGNASGSVPVKIVSHSSNMLKPKNVCACAGNQNAGYKVPISTPSTATLKDNADGTFTVTFALGWSNALMLTDKLIAGETYEVIVNTVNTGSTVTPYLLDETYTVTRKLAYLSNGLKKIVRVKLDTNECYIGFQIASGSNSEVRTQIIEHPEVRVSSVKNATIDAITENGKDNKYYYREYHTEELAFDVEAIRELFPGFGYSNGDKKNMLLVAEKRAFQYGYYADGNWVDDVKSIDLSSVIEYTGIGTSPNGYLEFEFSESEIPNYSVEYTLAISEPYIGYTWSGLGDSITAGADLNGTWGFYRYYVRNLLGLNKYNDCGVGTSALSGVGSYRAFWTDERVETLPLTSDVITIMGGTNDSPQYVAETNPGDKWAGYGEATLQNHDCRTFIGAYNVLISKVFYKFMLSDGYYADVDYTTLTRVESAKPWFRLVLIAPPPVLTSANTIAHMIKVAESVHKVGKLWGLPVVDAHNNLGINDINKDSFFTVDYVHPNEQAHRRLANLVIAKAREIN